MKTACMLQCCKAGSDGERVGESPRNLSSYFSWKPLPTIRHLGWKLALQSLPLLVRAARLSICNALSIFLAIVGVMTVTASYLDQVLHSVITALRAFSAFLSLASAACNKCLGAGFASGSKL